MRGTFRGQIGLRTVASAGEGACYVNLLRKYEDREAYVMKSFLISSVAAVLLAGPAVAQAGYDLNKDEMIDRDEFRGAYGDDVFGLWDANEDDVLSREEYRTGVDSWGDDEIGHLYDPWADEETAELSPEDFQKGMWTHYDVDKSGTLESAELKAWDEYQMRYDATRSGREVSQ